MYLSSVHLSNWRSYRDAEFRFKPPTKRRPLVLIGAMNGHGKTSFLLSLYLGLFGRFGLRHAEGFGGFESKDIAFYRQAVTKFRRNSASVEEPTTIDLSFSPTRDEEQEGQPSVRVVRRWFFSADGRPKQGDAFEEVDVYINDKPQKLSDSDSALARIERHLFNADFMPAFFFDGEQAQTLINTAGEAGIKKSVEVLFGTKVLKDVDDAIKQFVVQSRVKMGGARNISSQQQAVNDKLMEREKLEIAITGLQQQFAEADKRRIELEKEQQLLNEKLSRLGGASRGSLDEIQRQLARAEQEVIAAEEAITAHAGSLATALAVSRLAPTMEGRLRAERIRERWENLRDGTMIRTDEVLRVALPEPPESDDLLGHLHPDIRRKVRERFAHALEQIYHPPPDGCATEYRLGHAKGENRERLMDLLQRVRQTNSDAIFASTRRLQQARDTKQDLEARRARFADLPREVQQIAEQIKAVISQISECSRQLGSSEREVSSKKSRLHALNAEIGQLQEHLAALGPEQRRIAIAERVHRTLEDLTESLRPIVLRRMEETLSSHFVSIADRRFRDARVEFPDGTSPILRQKGSPDQLIEMMSGFERRSFGVAFSLALAELTQRRMPLVIDTPLGNADTEYRPRLLRALTETDLDQIIILTHDAEVTPALFETLEAQVQQTFLIDFDAEQTESMVHEGRFFNGVGG